MKLIKVEPGYYDVYYKGVLIGEVQKRGISWFGYRRGRGNYDYNQIVGRTCREVAVSLIQK